MNEVKINQVEYLEVTQLLQAADRCAELSGYVYPEDTGRKRIGIYQAEKIVGFFTPREESDDVWRMGAIFVAPESRGKGFATFAIETFMSDRKGRAFIEKDNPSSQRAYEKAGFKKVTDDPENKGAWFQNF